jgi:hypothetical protein
MTPDQLREVQERLRKDKELQKQTAKELRSQGKTQPETAAIIGIPQQTLSDWEKQKRGGDDTSNTDSGNACSPPDCRVKIPQSEHERIYGRIDVSREKLLRGAPAPPGRRSRVASCLPLCRTPTSAA